MRYFHPLLLVFLCCSSSFSQGLDSEYLNKFISNLERSDSEEKDGVEVLTKIFSLKGSQVKSLEKNIESKSDFYNLIAATSKSLLVQKHPIQDKTFSGVLTKAYSCEGYGKAISDSITFVYNENTFEYEKTQLFDTIEIELRTEFLCFKGISPEDWIATKLENEQGIVKTEYGYNIPSGYQKKAPLYIIVRENHLIITNNKLYLSSSYLRINKAKQKEALHSLLAYEFGNVDWGKIADSNEFFTVNKLPVSTAIISKTFRLKKKQLLETTKLFK